MSFLAVPLNSQRIIPGEGDKNAKICIIGEAGGAEENRLLRPFVGAAGTVLDNCLQAANVSRRDCYITNVVKVQPKENDISPFFKESTMGRFSFTEAGKEWCDKLYEELDGITANVLVPLGKVAMAAVTGLARISERRGYVHAAIPRLGGRKTIPAYHPAASLRGQYILRYYITADLRKAKLESAYPEIRRPQRRIIVPTTFAECAEWIGVLKECTSWACDIEVVNYEVSAIGFSPAPDLAISIPMYHEVWTLQEEAMLWRMIGELMGGPAVKIFQNGIFDIHFLRVRNGIVVQPPIDDTMISHHVQYPEMLKGLGFLVSMYGGSQEYYKDMVKWDNIKKEA